MRFLQRPVVLPLPEGHRFPAHQYALLRDNLARLEGVRMCSASAARAALLA